MSDSMPMSRTPSRTADVPRPAWTGRLDFDLQNSRGWRVATVEIIARIESVTVWCGSRTLAVMDRELFREWLIHPRRAFEIDDVTWSVEDTCTCITIDGSLSHVVPPDTVRDLVAVI
jgi:hypothetical protein